MPMYPATGPVSQTVATIINIFSIIVESVGHLAALTVLSRVLQNIEISNIEV